MARRMAAWRAHAAGELRLQAVRAPPLREPDELLIKVHSSSVNPIDVKMLQGYGFRVLDALRSVEGREDDGVPLTVGRDFTGEVVSRGPAATTPVGARVWGVVPPQRRGAHAQLVAAREKWTGALPEALWAAGAGGGAGGALYAGLTALAALRAGGLSAARGSARGARVLLLGSGGVALMALQLLRGAGATVLVGCSEHMRKRVLELGAAGVLDRKAPDYEKQLAENGPYEVILDAAGLGGSAAGAYPWRFSRFVTLSSPALLTDETGLCGGSARAALELASQNAEARARGGQVRWAFFSADPSGIELLRRLASSGELRVPVERVFPWWEARDAYATADSGSRSGKIMLDFSLPPPPDLAYD